MDYYIKYYFDDDPGYYAIYKSTDPVETYGMNTKTVCLYHIVKQFIGQEEIGVFSIKDGFKNTHEKLVTITEEEAFLDIL